MHACRCRPATAPTDHSHELSLCLPSQHRSTPGCARPPCSCSHVRLLAPHHRPCAIAGAGEADGPPHADESWAWGSQVLMPCKQSILRKADVRQQKCALPTTELRETVTEDLPLFPSPPLPSPHIHYGSCWRSRPQEHHPGAQRHVAWPSPHASIHFCVFLLTQSAPLVRLLHPALSRSTLHWPRDSCSTTPPLSSAPLVSRSLLPGIFSVFRRHPVL